MANNTKLKEKLEQIKAINTDWQGDKKYQDIKEKVANLFATSNNLNKIISNDSIQAIETKIDQLKQTDIKIDVDVTKLKQAHEEAKALSEELEQLLTLKQAANENAKIYRATHPKLCLLRTYIEKPHADTLSAIIKTTKFRELPVLFHDVKKEIDILDDALIKAQRNIELAMYIKQEQEHKFRLNVTLLTGIFIVPLIITLPWMLTKRFSKNNIQAQIMSSVEASNQSSSGKIKDLLFNSYGEFRKQKFSEKDFEQNDYFKSSGIESPVFGNEVLVLSSKAQANRSENKLKSTAAENSVTPDHTNGDEAKSPALNK